jgi:hypothetical protein
MFHFRISQCNKIDLQECTNLVVSSATRTHILNFILRQPKTQHTRIPSQGIVMTINQVWNQRELKMNKKSSKATLTQFNNNIFSPPGYGLFHLIKENLNTLDLKHGKVFLLPTCLPTFLFLKSSCSEFIRPFNISHTFSIKN